MKHILGIVLSLMLLSISFNMSLAGPDTASGLAAMFDEFTEFEEKIESGEWEDSHLVLQEINTAFVKILPELRASCHFKDIEQYGFLVGKLKDSISNKNAVNSQKIYIALQCLFFDLMDNYKYKIPPELEITAKYLLEAEDHYNAGNYYEVINEMNEICCFWEKVSKKLTTKGVSSRELENCGRMLVKVKSAAKDKNAAVVEGLISELKNKSTEYISLYKQ